MDWHRLWLCFSDDNDDNLHKIKCHCRSVLRYMFLGLFIDVGTNYSVLDHTNLSFIYEDVLSPGPNSDGEFVCIIADRLSDLLCRRLFATGFFW